VRARKTRAEYLLAFTSLYGRNGGHPASEKHLEGRTLSRAVREKPLHCFVGGALRARTPGGQAVEAVIACNVLNQMTAIGRPESAAIGR
jgi:hypothetical protein